MKSRIQIVNWRRPAWIGLALLCAFLIGCTAHTHRRPERTRDEGYIIYDTKNMIYKWGIPKGYLDDPDTKVRLVFIGPRWKIVRDWEWAPHINYYCQGLFVEDLRLLARKGGLGTWKVVLIVKKPGRPPLKITDKFTLSRSSLRAR